MQSLFGRSRARHLFLFQKSHASFRDSIVSTTVPSITICQIQSKDKKDNKPDTKEEDKRASCDKTAGYKVHDDNEEARDTGKKEKKDRKEKKKT